MEQKVITFCQNFFNKIQVSIISLEITEESNANFLVNLNSDDGNLFIENKKEAINSAQRLIQICVSNLCEEKIIIKLKVNNHLTLKGKNLYSFIDEKIKLVLENGGEYMLPAYGLYERRKIHSYIAHIKKGIQTKSRGEGKNRRIFLIINKKEISLKNVKSKLTIDINGDNI